MYPVLRKTSYSLHTSTTPIHLKHHPPIQETLKTYPKSDMSESGGGTEVQVLSIPVPDKTRPSAPQPILVAPVTAMTPLQLWTPIPFIYLKSTQVNYFLSTVLVQWQRYPGPALTLARNLLPPTSHSTHRVTRYQTQIQVGNTHPIPPTPPTNNLAQVPHPCT